MQSQELVWLTLQLPAWMKRRIRIRAASNGHTLSEEVRRTLEKSFESESVEAGREVNYAHAS